MPDTWLLIPWHVTSGPFHMALDAALLRLPPERPVLRLYGWTPKPGGMGSGLPPDGCISLGRFQRNIPPGVLDALTPFGLTRRATGGGAIYHWRELTYSVTGPLDRLRLLTGREAAYARFHQAWIAALAQTGGIPKKSLWMPSQRQAAARNDNPDALFCFTRRTGYDVLAEYISGLGPPSPLDHPLAAVAAPKLPPGIPAEGKLIGSAQRHLGPVLLQHGSIKLDRSPLAPWEVSLSDLSPTGLREWRAPDNPATLDYPRLSSALATAFAAALGIRLEPWNPGEAQLALAHDIAAAQFADQTWIRTGRTPRQPSSPESAG